MKKQRKITLKPERAWVIGVKVEGKYYAIFYTIRRTRTEAILSFVGKAAHWNKYRKLGYDCIPIEIRAVKK